MDQFTTSNGFIFGTYSLKFLAPTNWREEDNYHNNVSHIKGESNNLYQIFLPEFDLSLFNRELDRCTNLFLDFHIHKLRDEDNLESVLRQVTPGERQGFNSLIHGAGTNGLNFSQMVFAEDSSNRPGNCRSSGGAPNLDNVHYALLGLLATMSEPLFRGAVFYTCALLLV